MIEMKNPEKQKLFDQLAKKYLKGELDKNPKAFKVYTDLLKSRVGSTRIFEKLFNEIPEKTDYAK